MNRFAKTRSYSVSSVSKSSLSREVLRCCSSATRTPSDPVGWDELGRWDVDGCEIDMEREGWDMDSGPGA